MAGRYFIVFCMLAGLSACSSNGEKKPDGRAELSAMQLYREAKSALDSGDYEMAIQKFESLEGRFPFGPYAQQAQIDIAYAYYKFDEAESAVGAADRFIKMYPRHPRVDYAYFIKGLAKFNQGHSAFDNLPSQDPAKRDPAAVQKSYQYFQELLTRFPDSIYADDARQRLVYLRNNLARFELYTAEFYFQTGAYVAAANRGKYILEHFARTPSIPGALAVMARAYHTLGLSDLEHDTLRVIALNYPDHAVIKELRGKVAKK
ncbi:MAG: outer membrane protein assembly factor BamD [Pseudomonadota bacterium]